MIRRLRGTGLKQRLDPWSGLWLTAVWILLWGELNWFNVVGGFLVALTLLLIFPMPRLQVPMTLRPVAAVRLGAVFVKDLVVASSQVASMALFSRNPAHGSLFEVSLRSSEQLFVTTTAGMTTLVPGSVVVDIDRRDGTLLIHGLGVLTPEEQEAFRARVRRQEELLLRAFDRDCDETLSRPLGGDLDDTEPLESSPANVRAAKRAEAAKAAKAAKAERRARRSRTKGES